MALRPVRQAVRLGVLATGTIDGNSDGFPDALDPARIGLGTVDPSETDVNAGGFLFECVDASGVQDAVAVSTCEPLDTVLRPADETDDGDSCGCRTTPASAPFASLLVVGLLALVTQRARRGNALADESQAAPAHGVP